MQKITHLLTQETLNKAIASPRKRMNHNFHSSLNDAYQRMLNCLMPETYCRPHRHSNPEKNETFVVLDGRALVIEFDEKGSIIDYIILDREKGNYGVDFLPNIWHTIIALTPCIVFEGKDGPYVPLNEKDFAPWAPPEGSPEASIYNQNLLLQLDIK